MIPQTPRHDFLHELHKLLRPATYLEIGVQTGRSMAQALRATHCIGVDPDPQLSVLIPADNFEIHAMTSDQFFGSAFAEVDNLGGPIDLAFIDGMHLVENCLRDFIGVERRARPDGRSVAVFDDVLPYSADIAGRVPLPGDWAGDCWKVYLALTSATSHLRCILVDVAPTGALVVLGLDPANTTIADSYHLLEAIHTQDADVPEWMLRKDQQVYQPTEALDLIREHLNITEGA